MADFKNIIIIGGGGHAKVVIDAIKRRGEYNISGVIDNKLKPNSNVLGVKVLGGDSALPALYKKGIKYAFIGIGSVGDCSARKKIYKMLKHIGFKLPAISHPEAVISQSAVLGPGVFVAARAVINPCVKIGKNSIINTCSSIDHDCIIGDFIHIAPGATLSGEVKVDDETHIGTGANIIQCIKIGKKCMIGSGITIRKDVDRNTKISLPRTKRTFIIAEAGVNHNGSINTALKMVDMAKWSGADAVKFQTFVAENVVNAKAPKAMYQKKNTSKKESQLDMLKSLELKKNDYSKLIAHAKKTGIKFLSTPFDIKSAELLNSLGVKIFKVASGEITNMPLLKKIGSFKKKVILSTGMATLDEVKKALDLITECGTKKRDVTVMHCNTEYPTPYEDVNLYAMLSLRDILKVDIGYSDHTKGIEVPIAAVTIGASTIEKHFTLSGKMKGPDHKASLEPIELKNMILAIRNIEIALGDGIKRPSKSESKNKKAIRKSIYANRPIKKNEIFNEENIITKRPAIGISSIKWDDIIGRRAKKVFKKDEPIKI